MDEKIRRLRKKAMNLPALPGVYIMHDKNNNIIYSCKFKNQKRLIV